MRQTSLLAFWELHQRGVVSNRQAEVFVALSEMEGGGTDREVACFLGVGDPNYVRPRRNELEKLGIVFASHKRACAVSGKMAIVWKVSKV